MGTMTVKDGNGADQVVNTLPATGQALAAASLPVVIASDQTPIKMELPTGAAASDAKLEAIRLLLAGGLEINNDAGNPLPVATPAGLATDNKLEAIRLLLANGLEISNDAGNPLPVATPAGLATDAKLELIRLLLAGGIEISNDAGNPIPVSLAGGATAANQAAEIAAIATVGTRAFSAGIGRLAYAAVSASSAAIVATEVMVHNCGAARCFVAAGAAPVATTNDIPIEAGEKFTLRIASGHKIAALQDTAAGNLNIVPVA